MSYLAFIKHEQKWYTVDSIEHDENGNATWVVLGEKLIRPNKIDLYKVIKLNRENLKNSLLEKVENIDTLNIDITSKKLNDNDRNKTDN